MGNIKAAIDALKTVSIVCGMVPVVGENLKSAVELASTICEQVQTMKESHEGYQQLGIQVAELITAIARALQQSKQDEARAMQDKVDSLMTVLEEIDAAVKKRLPSADPDPRRKRDRLSMWIRDKAKDTKRRYEDPEELAKMRQKLQNVVDGFTVFSLVSLQLDSLQNKHDVNALITLTTRMIDDQKERDAKREAEAEHARQVAERDQRDKDIALLDSLRPVASAAWNAPIATDDAASASETTVSWCTPGTRVSLLKDILAWATAPNSPCVFWLNGLAGTGKSTVARTLCERLHKRNLLGASFFISRGQAARRDTSTIVHTIAHQLAFNRRPFSDALCAKLRERPLSVTRLIQDQISDFIIAPSRALPDGARFVIVIDALDESSPDSWGRPGGELLLPLVRQLLQLDGRVRVFITSRNEISIQQMFKELSAIPQTIDVVKLHELDKAVVKDDITTYLNHSFTMIRETRVDLTLTGWPSLDTVSELIERSGLLFIYAATAVRFMTHPKQSPRVRLDQLLRHNTATGTSPYVHLDGLYRQILDDAVRDSENNDLLLRQRLQAVMAVIVLAQTPLDINALATFSGESPDDVSIVIASLSSLLTDSAGGVRVFHPSFPDFAIDTTRCTDSRLCVVPAVDHSIIALRCLSLMNKDLRYNICNLRDPTVANSEIQDLELALRMNVSDVLSYAVCFWCTHLGASGAPDDAMLNALDEMCRKHLFHWIEVLSLVQHVPASEAALLKVIEWCERYPSGTTSLAISLLRDVARVLQVFATPIRSHALHAYHSAFVTMPHCLLLETLNTENLPGRIPRLVSPRAAHWGPSPRVLEGHSHWVMCVTFSRDGKRIASSSFDRTVRVWNAITFEPLAKLDGHQDEVTSVSFSPNGMHLISGSVDGTVRIWDAVAFESLAVLDHGSKVPVWSVVYPPSGEHIISGSEDGIVRVWSAITFEQHAKLEGHREPVRSVAFSPSGTYMVAASDDWTVSIWNAVTFKRIAELSHKYKVWSVSYSPDGMRILSGSIDHTVRIWDAITFKQLAVLKGHKMGVRSVAFSSDGTRIVSVSWDHTVRIWDAITFQQIGELEGHQGVAYTVAFSPDGTHMATGSRDHFVRVWNMRSSEKVATLEGHQGNIRCVAFSPDGAHITSCSDGDWTVRVWNSSTFEQLAELKGHRDEIKSVSFSHDGTHIASGSNDCTVRIWDAVSYEQLAVLEGHLNTVSSVAFSSDSTRVASGSQDFTVRIWDMVTLEQIAELRGPQHVIWSVAFSPDCTLIVSGSNDRMVHVWSGVTFELLAKLDEHRESVNSVEFSHDNKVIHSRDQSSREISWICSNSDTSAWTKFSSIEFPSRITSTNKWPETELTLSGSGWLSCSYDVGHTLVWLPVERRGQAWAACRGRVVIGGPYGAMTVLEMPTQVD